MIVLGTKSQQVQQFKEFNQVPFETQMSQQFHLEDKQFSPWVHKKTKKVNDLQSNKNQQHKFLANINLKHKKVENQQNFQQKKISSLRKNLQNKLKAERIHNQDYIQLIKGNRKSIQQKMYFQKRSNFRSFQKKPKYLDLDLELEQKMPIGVTKNNSPSNRIYMQGNKKKQNNILIKKAKKVKKLSKEQRQFAKTMKDFHKMDITQERLYKTLQLNVYPMAHRKSNFKDHKQKQQRARFTSLNNNRTKYNSIKLQRQRNFENYTMTCQGKNLLSTPYVKSRRQKMRKQFQQKQMKQVIFLQ